MEDLITSEQNGHELARAGESLADYGDSNSGRYPALGYHSATQTEPLVQCNCSVEIRMAILANRVTTVTPPTWPLLVSGTIPELQAGATGRCSTTSCGGFPRWSGGQLPAIDRERLHLDQRFALALAAWKAPAHGQRTESLAIEDLCDHRL